MLTDESLACAAAVGAIMVSNSLQCSTITTAVAAGTVLVAYVILHRPKPSLVETHPPVLEGDETLGVYEKRQHWTTDCTETIQHPVAKTGIACERPMTLIEVSDVLIKQTPNVLALSVERPCPPMESKGVAPSLPLDQWKQWTYSQYFAEATNAAKGFMKYGTEMHGTVAVYGFNAPEWHMSSFGAMFAGGKVAGIYPTDGLEQVKYKLRHIGAAVAVVENQKHVDLVLSAAQDLPDLRAIVTYDYEPTQSVVKREKGLEDLRLMTWKQLCEEGAASGLDAELEKRKKQITPGSCCAIVFTSGATGRPKAVMMSHDNFVCQGRAIDECYLKGSTLDTVRILSYLPLSHVVGMLLDIVFPTIVTSQSHRRAVVYFARPYDLKEGTFAYRLTTVRPSVFFGVPRVWEKITEKLKAIGAKTTGLKKAISSWAKATATKHAITGQVGGDGSYPLMYGMAKTILGLVKKKLGLDECVFSAVGGAPVIRETLAYFGSLGIDILELYGMSESCGPTTVNTPNTRLQGSTGYSIPGTELAIFQKKPDGKYERAPLTEDLFNVTEEQQGEVFYRGRHIMMGYMANPKFGKEHVEDVRKNNEEAIDDEGWLHSGDMGVMDVNGMVRITGRYKELIIGAGGENIAPVPIEDDIKSNCPAISNIMMVGDQKKYNVCLITLKAVGATGELAGTNELAGDATTVNPEVTTTEQAAKCPIWNKYLTDIIKKTNENSSVVPSNAAKIQKFLILPRDFSIVGGEFTPTLKFRRNEVCKIWAKEIDSMY
eukprot:GEMP01003911.1.p1 GENE.GEMP01003911.1~~GEMP01003911.1.p1  ORF type:complete len:771 (+),score=134.67 GEMP01003911.1:151-2463(+)